MFLGDRMILNLQLLPVAKLLDRLGEKLLVHVVVEIINGHLHLGRLPHIELVDQQPRHRQLHRVLLLAVPVDLLALARIRERGHDVMEVAGNCFPIVPDDLFASVFVDHGVQNHLDKKIAFGKQNTVGYRLCHFENQNIWHENLREKGSQRL